MLHENSEEASVMKNSALVLLLTPVLLHCGSPTNDRSEQSEEQHIEEQTVENGLAVADGQNSSAFQDTLKKCGNGDTVLSWTIACGLNVWGGRTALEGHVLCRNGSRHAKTIHYYRKTCYDNPNYRVTWNNPNQ